MEQQPQSLTDGAEKIHANPHDSLALLSTQGDSSTKPSSISNTSSNLGSVKERQVDIPETTSSVEYPNVWKASVIVITLLLCIFLVALDQTIIGTAIPKITNQFNSIGDIGWYGSAYFLTSTALQPSFGRAYKVFNVRHVLLTALFIFELGSLLCAIAPSSVALIVGRVIAGFGGTGIYSGTLVTLSFTVPLAKRPLVFGLFGLIWGVASVFGPLLGGVFTDKVIWRWCFYINLPIGGVSALVIAATLRAPVSQYGRHSTALQRIKELDLVGASLLIPGIVCLFLALQWGGSRYAWDNSRVIGLFIGFGLFTILFVTSQVVLGERATIPPRILRQRTVAAAALFALFFSGGIFLLMYYLPLFFQSIKGVSATQSGIEILPLMGGLAFSSIIIGGLVTAVGYYTPFLIGSQVCLCTGLGLLTTYSVDIPTSKWAGYQVLVGLGSGTGFQTPITAVQTVLSKEDVSVGSATIVFFQNLGSATSIAIAQAVFQNGLIRGLAQFAPAINPRVILESGATDIRNTMRLLGEEDQIGNVMLAYMGGLRDSYRVSLGVACVAAVTTFFFEWKSVKHDQGKKNVVSPAP